MWVSQIEVEPAVPQCPPQGFYCQDCVYVCECMFVCMYLIFLESDLFITIILEFIFSSVYFGLNVAGLFKLRILLYI